MSDIEDSIHEWKRTLHARDGLRTERADELEGRLRAELQHLRGAALSEREMFLIATHRLGRSVARAAEPEQADPRSVWRQRWIWMLSGYILLAIAWKMISNAQSLAQWFSRTQSLAVVNTAALATYALGIAGVIWLARRSVRPRAAFDVSAWQRFVGTRRGIVELAVVGLVVECLVVYGSWLGFRQLEWAPGDTRVAFSGWVGWTLLVITLAGVPAAALCTLLWMDRRREQGESRDERAEA
jgi:hypothetical protein